MTPAPRPGAPDPRPDPRSETGPVAVRLTGLRRTYGTGRRTFEAVRGVDLEVRRGSVTAVLGTNGAGKTSTLEVIEGLARPAEGTVEVLGRDPLRDRDDVRRRTGVLLQDSGFSGDLTVRETLAMWAATLSDPRPEAEVLGQVDLEHRADTAVRSLSGGERRRLDLGLALAGHPELLILDEPTTGLDPESRRAVWDLLRGLRDAGVTILFSTHYLEEAEALADELVILHRGRVVRTGTPASIGEGHRATITFTTGTFDTGPHVPVPAGATLTSAGGTTTIETPDLQRSLLELLTWADAHDVVLPHLHARTPSLESVFLAIAAGDDSPAPTLSEGVPA